MCFQRTFKPQIHAIHPSHSILLPLVCNLWACIRRIYVHHLLRHLFLSKPFPRTVRLNWKSSDCIRNYDAVNIARRTEIITIIYKICMKLIRSSGKYVWWCKLHATVDFALRKFAQNENEPTEKKEILKTGARIQYTYTNSRVYSVFHDTYVDMRSFNTPGCKAKWLNIHICTLYTHTHIYAGPM